MEVYQGSEVYYHFYNFLQVGVCFLMKYFFPLSHSFDLVNKMNRVLCSLAINLHLCKRFLDKERKKAIVKIIIELFQFC